MCGINGIFSYNISASAPKRDELIATRDHMSSRGPDGFGEYWSSDRRLGLGHRRLSIIDLLDRANQPMTSACGRYVVVFNGEIYNYPDLRSELERQGVAFRTTSDTEALLHLYKRDGEEMVSHLRGMFAFAIWDNLAGSLFLARDPYGIKPLYIANDGWTFRFASQVKALLAGGKVSRDPEPAGIVGFHLWGSVPDPFTLYSEIRSLPAGHSLFVDRVGPRRSKQFSSISALFAAGTANPAPSSEIMSRVRQAMLESVSAHLLADVEVGVFLSAGVDSGALLGLMRDAGQARVRAITLGFKEFAGTPEDETQLAADVAANYGAEHVVSWVSAAEFQRDLPAIMEAMDQPTIDGINSWFVAKAAKEAGLKVALSGLGGDELLAGYPSFRDVPRWVGMMRVPHAIPGLGALFHGLNNLTGLSAKKPKLSGLVRYGGTWSGAYFLRRALLLPFELETVCDREVVERGLQRLNLFDRITASSGPAPRSAMGRVGALESTHYLRNQLLRDSDWAGMAHSVEVRTPMVDSTLLEQLAPVTACLTEGAGKRALANAPSRALPDAIVDRLKTGFGVPTGHWLTSSIAGVPSSKGGASRAWGLQVMTEFGARQPPDGSAAAA